MIDMLRTCARGRSDETDFEIGLITFTTMRGTFGLGGQASILKARFTKARLHNFSYILSHN